MHLNVDNTRQPRGQTRREVNAVSQLREICTARRDGRAEASAVKRIVYKGGSFSGAGDGVNPGDTLIDQMAELGQGEPLMLPLAHLKLDLAGNLVP